MGIDRWLIVNQCTGYGLMPLISQSDWEQKEEVNLTGTERMLFDKEDSSIGFDKDYSSFFMFFVNFAF